MVAFSGCAAMGDSAGSRRVQFHIEATSGTSAARQWVAVLPVSGSQIVLDKLPVFDGGDVLQVDLAEVPLGPCLRFAFKPTAARALYRLTVTSRGRRLVLVVDGLPVGVRVIDEVLEDGVLYTFVEKPDAELPELVNGLNAGLNR